MNKLFFLISLSAPLIATDAPELTLRRIQAHMLIGDAHSAMQQVQQALQEYSDNLLIYEYALKCLASAGEEKEMLEVWERLYAFAPEKALEHDLLEEMAWGILKKGKETTGLSPKMICLIAAALTQDMRAVPFIIDGLNHSNAAIREVAVMLGAFYGDQPLREELSRLFREEKGFDVRLKVIEAIGKLKIDSLLPDLIKCVADPKIGAKEKLAAISAIVHMREKISRDELNVLATSNRAGLRKLACEVIAKCQLHEESTLLVPLMADSHPDVCAAALKTWGLLKKPVIPIIQQLASEAYDPLVGVTAAWVWLINDPKEGEMAMMRWLDHESPSVRALAASAVAASGSYGLELAKKKLLQTTDVYVQINLALALARQREACDQVCLVLENVMKNNHDQWMQSENGIFNTIEKSTVKHNLAIPNYPEVVNQTVRLELLNLLAILESPGALETIKAFLKERKWGVTGLAAETLLGEGDEAAIELVRELLHDSELEVRVEAALVLASWACDLSATDTLIEIYPKSDRQLQLKILESLGRIGDKKAIPFLIQCLKEPSLIIRMIAASMLIQTLNS